MLSPDEIHKIAALEQSHWWYRGMREIFFSLLEPYLIGRPRTQRILDIGCGTGGNLLHLTELGEAQGIDADPVAIDHCRQKGLHCTVASMSKLDVPPASFDLVTMFDVLYQAEPAETAGILSGIAAALAPGGLLAFREPAMPIAAGAHDRAVGGRQRFKTAGMVALLRHAGFEALRLTYLNTFLFPPIVALRLFQRLAKRGYVASDMRPTPEPLNALLLGLLRAEKHLLQFTNLPFGVSLFAVARKPTAA